MTIFIKIISDRLFELLISKKNGGIAWVIFISPHISIQPVFHSPHHFEWLIVWKLCVSYNILKSALKTVFKTFCLLCPHSIFLKSFLYFEFKVFVIFNCVLVDRYCPICMKELILYLICVCIRWKKHMWKCYSNINTVFPW